MELRYSSSHFSPKKRRGKKIIFSLFFICLCILGYYLLRASASYETPPLNGKWKSQETGKVLTFTDTGEVLKEDATLLGNYRILSPGEMEYTLNDKTFRMSYSLEGRQLQWGEKGQPYETFIRK